MTHPVDHLLTEWGAWVRRENRVFGGYAQVGYAEHIQASHSASDWVQTQVDPEILAMDALIRTQLPPFSRQCMVERYVNQLPDGRAARLVKISRSEYNKLMNRTILPQVRHLWNLRIVADISA